jgi:hypothetical protein
MRKETFVPSLEIGAGSWALGRCAATDRRASAGPRASAAGDRRWTATAWTRDSWTAGGAAGDHELAQENGKSVGGQEILKRSVRRSIRPATACHDLYKPAQRHRLV